MKGEGAGVKPIPVWIFRVSIRIRTPNAISIGGAPLDLPIDLIS